MAERVYNWSTGIALGIVAVFVLAIVLDVGSPIGETLGVLTLLAFGTSYVSWKMSGEPGRDSTHWIPPGGGLVTLLAFGVTFTAASALADPGIINYADFRKPVSVETPQPDLALFLIACLLIIIIACTFTMVRELRAEWKMRDAQRCAGRSASSSPK